MQYKILGIGQSEDTIITNVELTLDNGNIFTTDIAHFRPQSAEEIDNNIKNRLTSEQSKVSSIQACKELISTIVVGNTIII